MASKRLICHGASGSASAHTLAGLANELTAAIICVQDAGAHSSVRAPLGSEHVEESLHEVIRFSSLFDLLDALLQGILEKSI